MSFSRTKHEIFFCENTQKVLTNIKAKKKEKRFLCKKASKIEGINHTRDVGTPNGAGHRRISARKIFCVTNFLFVFAHTSRDSR